jgi:phosphoglycerate dehydrogenase-like enzyme
MSKLVVWCNQQLGTAAIEILKAGLTTCELVFNDPAQLPRANFVFGQPPVEGLLNNTNLRLVQLSSAGYTNYDRQDLRDDFALRGVALTKSSWVYDEPCADHALAMMLCAARALPMAQSEQAGTRAWSTSAIRERSFLLRDQFVLIVGYGSIGQRLAERLAPFGAHVHAARRSASGTETVPMTNTDSPTFSQWLGLADHVVNVLPLNSGTSAFFDERRFALMRHSSLFYNIGRGGTVDQVALESALRRGRLAGAYLDVTVPEPLPPEHSLWQAPNCFITPHTAGGHKNEQERLVELFLLNVQRLTAGQPLVDRIY